MALKTCPECGSQCGPRKKICDCNYAFAKPTKNKQAEKVPHEYLGQGTWVYDRQNGQPKLEIPNDIDGVLDNVELLSIISYEGLGYTILEYIEPNKIKDKKLAVKWQIAKDAMIEIIKHLENKGTLNV